MHLCVHHFGRQKSVDVGEIFLLTGESGVSEKETAKFQQGFHAFGGGCLITGDDSIATGFYVFGEICHIIGSKFVNLFLVKVNFVLFRGIIDILDVIGCKPGG